MNPGAGDGSQGRLPGRKILHSEWGIRGRGGVYQADEGACVSAGCPQRAPV